MTRKIKLSRRNLLASMGAIGAGAALGGAGTMALFNDEEVFEGNQLTAGELDLKIDWQQTYYGPRGTVPVNAYPDDDGDGLQSLGGVQYGGPGAESDASQIPEVCANLESGVDLPADVFDAPNRAAMYGGPLEQDRLVELFDVKPGDRGEVTFSVHLCDNPGYVWLTGEMGDNLENTINEPESHVDDSPGTGELADAIQTRFWYDDDCNNKRDVDLVLTIDVSGSMLYDKYGGVVKESGGPDGGVLTKIDLVEEAAKELVNGILEDPMLNANVGVVFFGNTDNVSVGSNLTDDKDALTGAGGVLDDLRQTVADHTGGTADPADGGSIATGTDIASGIELAQTAVLTDDDRHKANITLTNGSSFTQGGGDVADSVPLGAAEDAKRDLAGNPPTDLFTVGVSSTELALLAEMAGPAAPGVGAGDPVASDSGMFYDITDPVNIPAVFDSIVPRLGEKVVVQGSLAEVMTTLGEQAGVPLDGDLSTPFDELEGEATADGRECFDPSTTFCVGFEWWLPIDVGNEVQSDSVSFDVGFYTEQCRHNDGAGMQATQAE